LKSPGKPGAEGAIYSPFAASLMPPAALFAFPAILWALPSAFIFVSPVTLPAASLIEPLDRSLIKGKLWAEGRLPDCVLSKARPAIADAA
jgi:hypothetical protein